MNRVTEAEQRARDDLAERLLAVAEEVAFNDKAVSDVATRDLFDAWYAWYHADGFRYHNDGVEYAVAVSESLILAAAMARAGYFTL